MLEPKIDIVLSCISFQISLARLVGPKLLEKTLDLTKVTTDMLQAIEIAPRPQPEPHNEENKIKAIVKEEVVVSDVNSDEEKERELLVHIHFCWPISPINS